MKKEATCWLPPAARIGFGLMWAVDAALKWSPSFTGHLLSYFSTDGQPGWVTGYISWWTHLLGHDPRAFAYGLAAAESLIALGLLIGVGRRVICIGGALLSLLIWTTAEGFGGPYMPGSTDVGTSIAYVLVFALLATNAAAWPPLRVRRPSRRLATAAVSLAAVSLAAVTGLLVAGTVIASTGPTAPDSDSRPSMSPSQGGQMDMTPGGQDDH